MESQAEDVTTEVDQGLIFDIGVNEGEDSAFYVDKGFRVVGVEANPLHARAVEALFQDQIAAGQYKLLPVGIWSEHSVLPFYVNLANHHWSSFDRRYGCRDGTPFEVVDVPCITIAELVRSHGIPRYMK